MGEKSKPAHQGKKQGRSLKEKRAAKHEKQAAQKRSHKDWETR